MRVLLVHIKCLSARSPTHLCICTMPLPCVPEMKQSNSCLKAFKEDDYAYIHQQARLVESSGLEKRQRKAIMEKKIKQVEAARSNAKREQRERLQRLHNWQQSSGSGIQLM